ncbi:nuclear transport factor 2 family protein [Streptomyces globisporus]|uniref:nuclear transport factor 2 family protein n=1 Tax=Streptomyces TaxID=1883 RepID=UPI000BF19928|nr:MULTISPECIES: nuclear transport factor 2 family protein [Streptomyces]WSQ96220.1 nuclear transport factor 2 family protein [Streptomyces globisporus]WSU85807.1 nuclear transport factor 2 family protein [Streptomyces globisporus]WSV94228.1 nuclear transport factor 2 family protein [Streptomyces globisporus]
MSQENTDVNAAIDAELQLMDPAVRASRSLAARLLDPEFVEVGASGRRWTYEEMIAALPELDGGGGEGDGDGSRFEPSGMGGAVLAPGIVHLTYETVFDGRRARRSSLWRRRSNETSWRMYYHQATPVPAGE